MNLYTLDPVAKYLKESHSHLGITAEPYKQPKGNFLANPYSEYEERKRRFNDEYQSHLRTKDIKPRRPSSRHREHYSLHSPILRDPSNDPVYRRSPAKLSPSILGGFSSERISYKRDSNIFQRPSLADRLPKPASSVNEKLTPEPPRATIKGLRTPEPVEEYYPFGRPGAGAPYRDANGKPIGDRKLFAEHAKAIMNTPIGYREISPDRSFIVEERNQKDKQQEELRKALHEQVELRRAKEEEDRRRKLRQDKLEEERVRRQLNEIDSDIRRELQEGELSRTFEDPPPTYKVPQRSKRLVSRSESVRKHAVFRQQPVAVSPSPQRSRKFEAYRLRTETENQNDSVQDMISQLKVEKSNSKNYAWKAMKEFEDIKESVNYKSFSPDIKPAYDVQHRTGDYRWPSNDSYAEKALAGNAIPDQRTDFKTFESWGRHSALENDYSGVESLEARRQLDKLDELLKTTFAGPQGPDDEFVRGDLSPV